MPFPSPPWQMRAQAWLSLFAVREAVRPDRPGGLYGVAFVDYGGAEDQHSVLSYHELLVARLVRDGRRPQVRITDIWVDSEQSRDGGRALWAIPKELADLPLRTSSWGVATRASFGGVAEGRHLATASFVGTPGAARLRMPFATATSQVRDDGELVVSPFRGSTCSVPARSSWRFDPEGPLSWLHGRRPIGSFWLRDARLTFG